MSVIRYHCFRAVLAAKKDQERCKFVIDWPVCASDNMDGWNGNHNNSAASTNQIV